MRIIVMLKPVPEGKHPDYDSDTLRIRRAAEEIVINHDDANALETALSWREQEISAGRAGAEDIRITVLTMAEEKGGEDVLLQALARGADEAFLMTDDSLAGADTQMTARCLAAAVHELGAFDLILTGARSQDGRTGSVGPMLAEFLQIPFVSAMESFLCEGGQAEVFANEEENEYHIRTALPALLVQAPKEYRLRNADLFGLRRAFELGVTRWSGADLTEAAAGRPPFGTPCTEVIHVFRIPGERKGILLDLEENPQGLCGILAGIRRDLQKLI